MGSAQTDDGRGLVATLIAAFPDYLRRRLEDLGVATGKEIDVAIEQATDELSAKLAALLDAPATQQPRSPLELVREATLPVSSALAELGIPAPHRDDWEVAVHAEDWFGLYPASSRDLGEEAWRAHLDWGVDKARVVASRVPADEARVVPVRPAAGLFGIPHGDRAALVDAIEGCGFDALIWRNPAALAAAGERECAVVIVDLRHPTAHEAVRSLAADGARIVVTADQVDDLVTPGILAIGADDVVELDRLVAHIDRFLPRLT